jgi:hypothetical protein
MQEEGLFDKAKLADQIAILALYVPIIRRDLFSFVRVWNSHNIRNQRNRPGSVSGKPYLLYHHPAEGVQDHGLLFNEEKLRTIKEPVQDWDSTIVLPTETFNWCQDFFSSIDFSFDQVGSLETEIDRTRPYLQIYLQLQSALDIHIQSQQLPILSLEQSPTGVYQWQGRDQGQQQEEEEEEEDEIVRHVDLATDNAISI